MPMQSVREPSFIQGVSRQPDTQRLAGTAHEIKNSYVDLATGLAKRNGVTFKHSLSVTSPTDVFDTHWLLTGGIEFVMLLSSHATEPIQIFRLDTGVKQTVSYAGNASPVGTEPELTYVNGGSGTKRWRVLSVFDSTFIVNNEHVVATSGSATDHNAASIAATSGGTGTIIELDFTAIATPSAGATEGQVYKTLNSSVGRPAGYYQQNATFDTNDVSQFTRLVSPAANSSLDATTMPVQLLFDGASTFDVDTPAWSDRFSGDSITNPGPSFIGRTIDDIVFHKNRLWLFADEVVAASVAGQFFNFWLDDIYTTTAGDTIDEFVTDVGLNKIKYVVPFNKALNIFTEGDRQFEVRSVGPMAPDSISIIPTTSYGVSDSVRPARLGSQMYFFTEHTGYSQLYEYFQLDQAANNVANDISEHVKGYITDDITNITGEVNNGLIIAHGTGGRKVYPYKMTWSQNNKVQSAWSTWEYPNTGYTIMSSRVFGDNLWYLKTVTGASTTKLVLMSQPIIQAEEDADIPFNIHLDFLENFSSGTYDSGSNTTYWDLSYNTNGQGVAVVPTSGPKPGMSLAATVTTQSEHVSRVTVVGDHSTWDVVIGIPFEWLMTFNKPYVKTEQGAPVTGSFSIKKLIMYVKNIVQFTLTQTVPGISTPYVATYNAAQMAADAVAYNVVPVVEFDNPSFIILGKAQDMTLTISDTSEFPGTLVSGEFKGTFNARRPVR